MAESEIPDWVDKGQAGRYADLRRAQRLTEQEIKQVFEAERIARQIEEEGLKAYKTAMKLAEEGHSRKVIRACFGRDVFLRGE